MLREVHPVRQESGGSVRRWFRSDTFDLFLWQDKTSRHITGFQLCYDTDHEERALSWREPTGFAHNRIDTGEQSPQRNKTPIFAADAAFPFYKVMPRFVADTAELSDDVRRFVLGKMVEYAAAIARGRA